MKRKLTTILLAVLVCACMLLGFTGCVNQEDIDEAVTQINTTLDEMKATDSTLDGYITALTTRATALEAELEKTNEAIEELETKHGEDVVSLTSSLSATKTALEAEITSIKTEIEALKTKDTELENKITTLENSLSTNTSNTKSWVEETYATIESCNALKEEINSKITSLNSRVTTLETTVSSLSSTVTELSEKIEQNASDIANLQSAIEALGHRVDCLEGNHVLEVLEIKYVWAEDYSSCTAKGTCKYCGCELEEFEEEAIIKYVADTENNYTTITASFTDEAFETQTKNVTLYDEGSNTYTVYDEVGLLAWNTAAQEDLSINLNIFADITLTIPTEENASNWTSLGYTVSNDDPEGEEVYYYTGTINGNGYTISNLTICNTDDKSGFIYLLGDNGAVKNLSFENASITYSSSVSSAINAVIVCYNSGKVDNCHVISGNVSSNYQVGGVVAFNNDSGIVVGCSNNASVTCSSYGGTGGIVGESEGTVMGCVNYGTVKNTCTNNPPRCGGVVGGSYGSNAVVIACANYGTVEATRYVGGIAGEAGSYCTLYASWTVDTMEDSTSKDGVGYNSIGNPTVTACYSTTATDDVISAMNAAIVAYNESATVQCDYVWNLNADDLPVLVLTTAE